MLSKSKTCFKEHVLYVCLAYNLKVQSVSACITRVAQCVHMFTACAMILEGPVENVEVVDLYSLD